MIPSNMPDKSSFKNVADYYQAVKDSGLELFMDPEEFIRYMKWCEVKKFKTNLEVTDDK